jgi:lipid-binding SYLF domain-containing protein
MSSKGSLRDHPCHASLRACLPGVRTKARLARTCIALATVFGVTTFACSKPRPAEAPRSEALPQQRLVERAAAALARMRDNPKFASMEPFLEKARAVMIFPRLIKASLLFGGEGGNGVLIARSPDGSWSDPAFYSLGAPSVGLQIGYQEATVILFVMDDVAFRTMLGSSVALGANTTVAVGDIGDAEKAEGEVIDKPIYQLVEAGGVFAGVSLDGYVIAPRSRHNFAYYGASGSPTAILLDRSVSNHEARVLHDALGAGRRATP